MRPFHTLTSLLLIPALLTGGCAGLDTSARSEGTGIQIIGAVVVLAKYRASERQKAIAEEKARRAFVDLGLKPAYEARAKKLKRTVAQRSSRGSGSKPPARGSGSGGSGRATAHQQEPDPAAEARAELASLSASWKSTASSLTNGRYAGDFAAGGGESVAAVDFPRVSESQVLAAAASYAPRYIAVSVPSDRPVAGAKDQLMIWDTRTQQLASDTVYAVDRTPPAGQPSRIDDVKAQFAGGQ